jgi:hypothetical protein
LGFPLVRGGAFASTLTNIDFNNKPNLDDVIFAVTFFSELDVSTNINLRSFTLANNHEMTYVNLRNGNNANNMIVEINSSNENIECIQVDDPQAVIARLPPYQWW